MFSLSFPPFLFFLFPLPQKTRGQCFNAYVNFINVLLAYSNDSDFVCGLVNVDVVCAICLNHNGRSICIYARCAGGKGDIGDVIVIRITNSEIVIAFQNKSEIAKLIGVVGILDESIGFHRADVNILG